VNILTLVDVNPVVARESYRLTLRKEKVEDHFMRKREEMFKARKLYANLEIKQEELDLPKELFEVKFDYLVRIF
jgi:hypothetical protein